ncbi:MAG: hypothetical protein JW797_06000 [Bradymonadales bacterium]|nr:hypothetical protein [Bradymonadales bacterium]
MSRVKRTLFACAFLGAAVLLITMVEPRTAQAQSANLSVQVILASNSGQGMDGSLGSVASQLRARFGRYDSFSLLASHRVHLDQGSSESLGLPNGETLRISLLSMSGSSYRLQVSLPGGGTTVTAPPGGIFFVAGPRYQSGTIIVAITP